MNVSRTLLTRVTFLLVLIGLIFALIPFLSSLTPTEMAGESMLRVDVSKLQPNEYKILKKIKSSKVDNSDGSTTYKPGTSLLIIRDVNEDYYVYRLPTWEGEVLMPGPRSWNVIDEGACRNFGPEILDGIIHTNTSITCLDENFEGYFSKHWQWTLSGQNISNKLPDLMAVKYIKEGNELALKSVSFN